MRRPRTLLAFPSKDDDDPSVGDSFTGETDDGDEFEYPGIRLKEDDESDFDGESYSPSDDEDRSGSRRKEELVVDDSYPRRARWPVMRRA